MTLDFGVSLGSHWRCERLVCLSGDKMGLLGILSRICLTFGLFILQFKQSQSLPSI